LQGYTQAELEEARRALASTLAKCEKVLPKLKLGTASHTLLVRRIAALNVALTLIREKLAAD
jgi:hypothetical protein